MGARYAREVIGRVPVTLQPHQVDTLVSILIDVSRAADRGRG